MRPIICRDVKAESEQEKHSKLSQKEAINDETETLSRDLPMCNEMRATATQLSAQQ
jgi:hypothetical protein